MEKSDRSNSLKDSNPQSILRLSVLDLEAYSLSSPAYIKTHISQDLQLSRVPLGIILFFIFICETAGIANTSASNAAFLISLCVVLTPIVEGITFRQFPGWGILGAA